MSEAGSPRPSGPANSTGALRVSGAGFLLAVVSSILIYFSTIALLVLWGDTLPERPNFYGNGIMWLIVTIELFDIVVVSTFLLIICCLVIPLIYRRSVQNRINSISIRRLIVQITGLELFGCSILVRNFVSKNPLILAIVNAPIVLVTALALLIFLYRLNVKLATAT